jgi:serine protease Do
MHPLFRRYAAIGLVCFLCGISGGGALNVLVGARQVPFWTEAPRQTTSVQVPNFADIAERLKPAVVNISATQLVGRPPHHPRGTLPKHPSSAPNPLDEFLERFFGGNPDQPKVHEESLASGFIIDKTGYIVTNNHVVENAATIKVSLTDLERFDAKVVGRDPQTEVALIKIEAERDLPVAPLGNSDALRVGEWVVAIGNPFGLGQTLTVGVTSAKGRTIGSSAYDDFIQTDTSINPGNSGGPLLNLHGEVVGIITAMVPNGQGINFAIPINLAKEVVTQLRQKGRVTRGFLGVQMQQVEPELARSCGLERPQGALAVYVHPDGPAARAGLKEGDVILEFNGRTIMDQHELLRLIAGTPPGSEVAMKLIWQGRERIVQVTVGDVPEEPPQVSGGAIPSDASRLGQELGLTVQELRSEAVEALGLPQSGAIMLTAVEEGSPAEQEGLRRGDVILEVNEQPVANLEDFVAALNRHARGNSVLFLIRRSENTLYVALLTDE